MNAPMTPERWALIRVLQDAVWPFLAHDPANPDVFWGQLARKIEEHYAAEVDRLRAQAAAVEALAKKWDGADRVGQHRWGALEPSADALRAALASGDEVQP